MSYNFGEVGDRSQTESGGRELVGGGLLNETERNVRNAIIRFVCIDRYSGFKYRRSSESRGGAGTGIGGKAEERSKRHEVESTHDYQSHGNRKGRTEKDKQG